jgi:hypothetical protein
MVSWCGRSSQKACRLYREIGSSCNSAGNESEGVLVEVQDSGLDACDARSPV